MANTILNAGYVQFDNKLSDGLRVVWGLRVENFDQEIQIYDQLGLAYYYLGEIELSIFYHNKFATGDIERLDSPNRMMS
jgi:hypothetical protein